MPGQVYSVISSYGAHGNFTVAQSSGTYLTWLWPPVLETNASLRGIYRGARAPLEAVDIRLDGSNVQARLLPALDDFNTRLGGCVRLIWGHIEDVGAQPPPAIGDYSLDRQQFRRDRCRTHRLPYNATRVNCPWDQAVSCQIRGELSLGRPRVAHCGRWVLETTLMCKQFRMARDS